MATDRLDLDNLAVDSGNTSYAGAPDGLRIGHIHLRVGDLAPRSFYCDTLGLNPTAGAAAPCSCRPALSSPCRQQFWHSAGAGQRDEGRAGPHGFGRGRERCGLRRVGPAESAANAPFAQFGTVTEPVTRLEPGFASTIDA